MPIKPDSLEKTAETQISRQKSPINQYIAWEPKTDDNPRCRLSCG